MTKRRWRHNRRRPHIESVEGFNARLAQQPQVVNEGSLLAGLEKLVELNRLRLESVDDHPLTIKQVLPCPE